MSLLARDRSTVHRLRIGEAVSVERFGPLHAPSTMLEWGSITKTVTAAVAVRLDAERVLELDAPVSAHLGPAERASRHE